MRQASRIPGQARLFRLFKTVNSWEQQRANNLDLAGSAGHRPRILAAGGRFELMLQLTSPIPDGLNRSSLDSCCRPQTPCAGAFPAPQSVNTNFLVKPRSL